MTPDAYADFAAFYDLYVGDRDEDLPFYLDLCRTAGGPVLEVGAGTGRLTLPLARAGIPITAVDSSPEMLAVLRDRLAAEDRAVAGRVRILQADACGLDLGERFALVFLPFYTFSYMLTPQMQRGALGAVARHLGPGGRAVLDLFLPRSRIRACPDGPVLRVDRTDPRTGRHVRGWNVYGMDLGARVETRTHTFEVHGDGDAPVRTQFVTKRRWFEPNDLAPMFAEAGLRLDALQGGYRGERFDGDSETIVCLLGPAGEEA